MRSSVCLSLDRSSPNPPSHPLLQPAWAATTVIPGPLSQSAWFLRCLLPGPKEYSGTGKEAGEYRSLVGPPSTPYIISIPVLRSPRLRLCFILTGSNYYTGRSKIGIYTCRPNSLDPLSPRLSSCSPLMPLMKTTTASPRLGEKSIETRY